MCVTYQMLRTSLVVCLFGLEHSFLVSPHYPGRQLTPLSRTAVTFDGNSVACSRCSDAALATTISSFIGRTLTTNFHVRPSVESLAARPHGPQMPALYLTGTSPVLVSFFPTPAVHAAKSWNTFLPVTTPVANIPS